ncbi:MAG: FAD-binding protein [Betaproteobacteria bacterium]|nr:FAD-binding protein [Betaproteobacteria bacterium]
MSSANKPERTANGFDAEYDVVVVGYGYAGGVSAIEAAKNGAKVLLIEKASVPGGVSICSYGALRCASNRQLAFDYLKETNAGRTPDDVIRALADGMCEMEGYARELAKASGAEVSTTEEWGKGANYPLRGANTFYHSTLSLPGFDARKTYPWANGAPGGPVTFKVVEDNLARYDVDVWLSTEALRLISRDAGSTQEILGITVRSKTRGVLRVMARRGVILCTGGFEGNREMREQFWEGVPIRPCCGMSNSGDGIRMAQDVGAKLWHMWHFHGCYGFTYPDPRYPYMVRVKRLPDWTPGREGEAKVKMVWILLDQNGKRYMNEYQPYTQDTTHRPMQYFDPATQRYPRNPSFLICDENGRKMYPIGRPTSNDEGVRVDWSEDNMKEVEMGILKRADSIAELARILGVDLAETERSVARWNTLCDKTHDEDHGRPAGTMARIDTPPFYGAPVSTIVTNTQGGPVHNARQEIIDAFGDPIPRLFAAGEMGSSFGHLYMSGSNITECFVNGRIAGRSVMAAPPWKAADSKVRTGTREAEITSE